MEPFKAMVISNNRITIPKTVYKELNLRAGDIVTVGIIKVFYHKIRL